MTKQGIVTKCVGGKCHVICNKDYYTCTIRGIFRKHDKSPIVGDEVIINITDENKKLGTIHEILERKNFLIRPRVVNLTQVIVTISIKDPEFNPGLLDRILALVEYEDIPIIICVNKTDLDEADFEKIFAPYRAVGYPVVYVSTYTKAGLDSLISLLGNEISLFAGPSGVGKSSIINALIPELNLLTGDLSEKNQRGKHTTRNSELFPIGGGFIFDTPGFVSLELDHIDKDDRSFCFKEFRPFLGQCKFVNCKHISEKDCAIKEEIGKSIHPGRYESYLGVLNA